MAAPPIQPGALDPHPLVFEHQFLAFKAIEEFFGGKSDWELRLLFDYENMLTINIEVQKTRIECRRAGKGFVYKPLGSGEFMWWAREGSFIMTSSGPKVISDDPKDVLYLIFTEKFQISSRMLVGFINNGFIPPQVKQILGGILDTINRNNQAMVEILDARMHENDDYFFKSLDMATPFYGVINADFATRFDPLKPYVENLQRVIAEQLRIAPTNHLQRSSLQEP